MRLKHSITNPVFSVGSGQIDRFRYRILQNTECQCTRNIFMLRLFSFWELCSKTQTRLHLWNSVDHFHPSNLTHPQMFLGPRGYVTAKEVPILVYRFMGDNYRNVRRQATRYQTLTAEARTVLKFADLALVDVPVPCRICKCTLVKSDVSSQTKFVRHHQSHGTSNMAVSSSLSLYCTQYCHCLS